MRALSSRTGGPLDQTPRRGLVHGLIRWTLAKPAVQRARRALRDVRWSLQAASLRNPSLPEPPRSVLFVCLGNICRSPFAAALVRRRLGAGSTVVVSSAGLRTTQAARPPVEACRAAKRFGISLERHEPVQVTERLICDADLIVVMEAAQLVEVRQAYPAAAGRVVLLPLYEQDSLGPYDRHHIADPFGQPAAMFDACYERIAGALDSMLRRARLAASEGCRP